MKQLMTARLSRTLHGPYKRCHGPHFARQADAGVKMGTGPLGGLGTSGATHCAVMDMYPRRLSRNRGCPSARHCNPRWLTRRSWHKTNALLRFLWTISRSTIDHTGPKLGELWFAHSFLCLLAVFFRNGANAPDNWERQIFCSAAAVEHAPYTGRKKMVTDAI